MRLAITLFLLICSIGAFAQDRAILIPCKQVNNNTSQPAFDTVFKRKQVLKIDSRMWSLALDNSKQLGNKFRMGWEQIQKFDFILNEKNILSDNYTLEVAGENGSVTYPASKCFTYEGHIIGEPQSLISLSIREGFVFGFFKINPSLTYFIEPASYYDTSLSNDSYVVYNTNDVIWTNPAQCGVKEINKIREGIQENAGNRTPGQCRQVQLAIASDLSMFVRYGTATAVENHNIGVINNVITDYRNNGQFSDDLDFNVVKMYQSTTTSMEPLLPGYSGTNSNIILNNFKAWGNAGNFALNYDLATLWTTRNLDEDGAGLNSSLVGLSFVGSVCGNSGYLVLEDYLGGTNNGSGFGLRVLASHEIGHSFNCGHDATSGYIMSPAINNTSEWSTSSVSAVNAFSSGAVCLSTCASAGAPVAAFRTFSDINCTNTAIVARDFTANGPNSWFWTSTGGTISPTNIARNVTVTFPNSGTQSITLLAENNNGSSSVTQNVRVFSRPAATCISNNGTLSDAGITYFELGPLSKMSGSAAMDGSEYIDNICSSGVFLNTSTSYPMVLTTTAPGFSSMGAKIYIDYNNNGVLTDIGENVKTIPSTFPPGQYNLGNITTPSNPVMNTLLRVRVIAGTPGDVGSPCFDPINGQVEDYGIVFSGSLPLELLSFSGRYERRNIYLEWTTYNEYQNKGFEVERSYDGIHFNQLMFVEGKGGNNYRYRYEFKDNAYDCKNGTLYYRLKMIDQNGQFEYSKIVSVATHCAGRHFDISPNPFQDELRLRVNAALQAPLEIEIYDSQGRQVINKFSAPENVDFGISTTMLPTGVYFLKIQQEQQLVHYQKLIKLN